MAIIELVLDPDSFFEREERNVSLSGPVTIVFFSICAAVLSQVVLITNIQTEIPDSYSSVLSIGMIFGALSSAIGIVVLWVIYSSLFQVISRVFAGAGSFRSTLLLAGWGFFPLIFSGIFSAALIHVLGVDLLLSLSDIQSGTAAQNITADSPTVQLSKAVGIVFSLWSWFLWSIALKHTRNITLSEAMVSTGIPVGLTTIWQITKLL